MTRRLGQEWSSIEQVAIAEGLLGVQLMKEVTKLLRAELQGCGSVAPQETLGVDCGSVGNPKYLRPFPL